MVAHVFEFSELLSSAASLLYVCGEILCLTVKESAESTVQIGSIGTELI